MKGELLFLGTGASAGVPMIGCHCSVCLSKDPHNKRLRPSALISYENKKLLIDTGPDLREQALKNKIWDLDGILITHSHYDHIAGIDELRTYYIFNRKVLPVLLSKSSFEELKQRYYYLFQEKKPGKTFFAQLKFIILEQDQGFVEFCDLPVHYMTYMQGGMKVTGYRFGDIAYLSDVRHYPESIFDELKGINTLIISALKLDPTPVHLSVGEAVAFSEKVNPKKTYLIHMGHELDYNETNAGLPGNVSLAYDGLKLEFFYDK